MNRYVMNLIVHHYRAFPYPDLVDIIATEE